MKEVSVPFALHGGDAYGMVTVEVEDDVVDVLDSKDLTSAAGEVVDDVRRDLEHRLDVKLDDE